MTIYNRRLFMEAHARYLSDPKSLTDADLEQFGIVDKALAERARAKRAGFVEAKTAEQRKEDKRPVTLGDLLTYHKDFIDPILATYRFKAATVEERIVALEQRLLEIEATLASLTTVPHADH